MSAELSTVPERQPKVVELLMLESTEQKLALVCPEGVNPKELLSVARGAVMAQPALQNCDPGSVLLAIQKAMICGLPLDGRHGHLIPYGKQCQFIADWKGYVALGQRCGLIYIHADVVCDGEAFAIEQVEMGSRVKHSFDFRTARRKPFGAYCQVINRHGAVDSEYMHRDEIEAIRKRSRAGNSGPWVSDWSEMAKKTVIRRMSKRWDIDTRYRAAMVDDEEKFPEAKKVELVMPDEALPPALGEPKTANLIEAHAQVAPEGAEEEINPGTGEYQWR